LGISRKPSLEPAIGYADYGSNGVAVRLPSHIGNAVLRNDDVAKRAGHGRVGVGPGNVGSDLAALMARAAYSDDGPGVGELMGHGDEIVLASNTADHPSVFESIGGDCAQQSNGQGGIDKSRMRTLGALASRIPAKRVGVRNRRHADLGQLLGR